MSNTANIPWGRIISNFIWIIGLTIILANFSFHEFISGREGSKLKAVLHTDSFKKPHLFGLILTAGGIGLSVSNPWLSVVFVLMVPFFLFLLIKK